MQFKSDKALANALKNKFRKYPSKKMIIKDLVMALFSRILIQNLKLVVEKFLQLDLVLQDI